MTLIEVIAALTLSAVLVTTLLIVSSSLRGDQKRMEQDTSDNVAANRRLARLFEYDLTHARTLETADRQVKLTGYGGLNRSDFTPRHRRTQVTYRQTRLRSGGEVLVREQLDLDNTTNRALAREVVALDVVSFTMERGEDSDRVRFSVTWTGDRPALEGTLVLSLAPPSQP